MTGIKFSFPQATQNILVAWYRNAAPLIEVGRSQPYPPSAAPYVLVPTGIQVGAYTFKFYETSDDVTLDTFLTSWSVDGQELLNKSLEQFHYVVDRGNSEPDPTQPQWADPVSDGTEIHDERLLGKDYTVFFRGTGPRRPDEFTDLPTGGFGLLNGETFANGDTITVLVGTESAAPSVSRELVNYVSANGAYDGNFHGATSLAQFTGRIGVTTFPMFNSVPDETISVFTTFTGFQQYWKLQLQAGETIYFKGRARNVIYLGRDEKLKLHFKADGSGQIVCYVMEYTGDYGKVGERLHGDKKLVNTEYADGTEYDQADYPRVIEELTAEQIVSYTDWDYSVVVNVGSKALTKYPNRTKFAVNDITGKFRFPDRRGMTLKGLEQITGDITSRLSQGAGGFQSEMLIEHDHDVDTKNALAVQSGSATQCWAGVKKGKTDKTGGSNQRIDNEGIYPLIGI